MSATSSGGSVGRSGGSVSEGSDAGESSQSTMTVTDSPSTSFQVHHENITKISLAEAISGAAIHVDISDSKTNLTLDERQEVDGVVNMGFEHGDGSNSESVECKSVNGPKKTEKLPEAVNLELVNMVPYSNGNGTSYGVPINGIPVKKDTEGADITSPYDEYFVPVNEHKKYMRGEKLYVTKDKRRPTSWRRCLSWIVGCGVISLVLIVAILAGTGVILPQEPNMVQEASVGRNFAGTNSKHSDIEGSLDENMGMKKNEPSQLSETNMTHMYVPRSIESELIIKNLEWNTAFLDHNSSEYKELSTILENQLKMIIFKKGILEFRDSNVGLNVYNISQNPLKVSYRIGWNYKEGVGNAVDPITMIDVKNRLVEGLTRNQGYMDKYQISLDTISVGNVINICQFNNGGCSHTCYYNYTNQQFMCTCPTNLILDSGFKTCIEWTSSFEEYSSIQRQNIGIKYKSGAEDTDQYDNHQNISDVDRGMQRDPFEQHSHSDIKTGIGSGDAKITPHSTPIDINTENFQNKSNSGYVPSGTTHSIGEEEQNVASDGNQSYSSRGPITSTYEKYDEHNIGFETTTNTHSTHHVPNIQHSINIDKFTIESTKETENRSDANVDFIKPKNEFKGNRHDIDNGYANTYGTETYVGSPTEMESGAKIKSDNNSKNEPIFGSIDYYYGNQRDLEPTLNENTENYEHVYGNVTKIHSSESEHQKQGHEIYNTASETKTDHGSTNQEHIYRTDLSFEKTTEREAIQKNLENSNQSGHFGTTSKNSNESQSVLNIGVIADPNEQYFNSQPDAEPTTELNLNTESENMNSERLIENNFKTNDEIKLEPTGNRHNLSKLDDLTEFNMHKSVLGSTTTEQENSMNKNESHSKEEEVVSFRNHEFETPTTTPINTEDQENGPSQIHKFHQDLKIKQMEQSTEQHDSLSTITVSSATVNYDLNNNHDEETATDMDAGDKATITVGSLYNSEISTEKNKGRNQLVNADLNSNSESVVMPVLNQENSKKNQEVKSNGITKHVISSTMHDVIIDREVNHKDGTLPTTMYPEPEGSAFTHSLLDDALIKVPSPIISNRSNSTPRKNDQKHHFGINERVGFQDDRERLYLDEIVTSKTSQNKKEEDKFKSAQSIPDFNSHNISNSNSYLTERMHNLNVNEEQGQSAPPSKKLNLTTFSKSITESQYETNESSTSSSRIHSYEVLNTETTDVTALTEYNLSKNEGHFKNFTPMEGGFPLNSDGMKESYIVDYSTSQMRNGNTNNKTSSESISEGAMNISEFPKVLNESTRLTTMSPDEKTHMDPLVTQFSVNEPEPKISNRMKSQNISVQSNVEELLMPSVNNSTQAPILSHLDGKQENVGNSRHNFGDGSMNLSPSVDGNRNKSYESSESIMKNNVTTQQYNPLFSEVMDNYGNIEGHNPEIQPHSKQPIDDQLIEHGGPTTVIIKHSEDFSNNIREEEIDNDEFKTLVGGSYGHAIEFSNTGKEILNKYGNKQTFLKSDRKKFKDIIKGEKVDYDKKSEVSTKSAKEGNFAREKHVNEQTYEDTNSELPITKVSTQSDRIPGLVLQSDDINAHDLRLFKTISPGSETEVSTQLLNEMFDYETEIPRTETKIKVVENKGDDTKVEKDYSKLDKEHKHVKGAKKKDQKKKGGAKDGKNVDDEKKYYSDHTEEDWHDVLDITTIPVVDEITTQYVFDAGKIVPSSISEEYSLNKSDAASRSGNHKTQPALEGNTKITTSSTINLNLEEIGALSDEILVTSTEHAESNNAKQFGRINYEHELTDGIVRASVQPSAVTSQVKTEDIMRENIEEIENREIKKSTDQSYQIVHGSIAVAKELSEAVTKDSGLNEETKTVHENMDSSSRPVGSLMSQEIVTNVETSERSSVTYPLVGKHNKTTGKVFYESPTFVFEEVTVKTVPIQTDIHNFTAEKSVGENNSTGRVIASGSTIAFTQDASYSGKNANSTFFTHRNSTGFHPKIVIHDQSRATSFNQTVDPHTGGIKFSNFTKYHFGNGTAPIIRIFNKTKLPAGASYTVHNYSYTTGSPTITTKQHNTSIPGNAVFTFNMPSHTFGTPRNYNVSLQYKNTATTNRSENGSLPRTVFIEHFDPTNGNYRMFTNSSGTFAYLNSKPSFVLKGNSGDFGRSAVYIINNRTTYNNNSSGPLRTHHVVYKNTTVIAAPNITQNGVPTTPGAHSYTLIPGNAMLNKTFKQSSFVPGTSYKVGDYFGYVSKCAAGQFQCINGTSKRGSACINLSSKCDSVNDCFDGSDEAGCIEGGCPGNFQCADGTCLKRHLVCNGIVECSDGSDEKSCRNWKCEFDEFQCPSGRCIPVVWQCDSKADCDNHTDEQNCHGTCGNDEYLCPEGWCIPLTYKCNGIKECSNGEDEQLCDCSLEEFKCQSGGCVLKSKVCDGLDDCPDRSDEWNCIKIETNSTLLKIRNPDGEYEPVCADNWSTDYSEFVCASLGYSSSVPIEKGFSASNTTGHSIYFLKNETSMNENNLLRRLTRKNITCSTMRMVEISCQEFSCGSRTMTDSSSAEGRLIGGMSATAGQWPSVALLYNVRNLHSCTANVLTPRWVLVSYNCLKQGNKNLNEQDWKLFAGSTVFDMENMKGETKTVKSIVPHPQVKFNQFLFGKDLALVKLDQSLSFSSNIGAICLPEQEIQPRQICVTAGWGLDNIEDKNIKQQLQYLPVPTMNLTECNSTEHYSGFITDDKVCAGYSTGEKSLCFNEEGAPLMCVNDRGEWELQGTLSYHSNCGRGSHPSIFNNITPIQDWIKNTIGNSFERKVVPNKR